MAVDLSEVEASHVWDSILSDDDPTAWYVATAKAAAEAPKGRRNRRRRAVMWIHGSRLARGGDATPAVRLP